MFVAEVPFPKEAGGVADFFEDLRKDGGVEGHALALEDGVGDAVFFRMASGHEGGAGGRAGGGDHEASEARAGVMESIEVGGFEPGMAMATDGREALVVGDDEDDVGAGAFEGGVDLSGCEKRDEEIGKEAHEGWYWNSGVAVERGN